MSDDLLKSKSELLQEQIDNLEKSGFFTEKEINQKSIPLKAQLSLLVNIQSLRNFAKAANFTADNMMKYIEACENATTVPELKYGMTNESYEEGKKLHEMLFNPLFMIPVNKPEILTPNHQEA